MLALSREDFDALPPDVEPERYLELFGIFPTPAVVHARLREEERHACHDAVDDARLAVLGETLRPWGSFELKLSRLRQVIALRRKLERGRDAAGLASIDELADDPRYGDDLERYRTRRIPVDAVREAVAHLACDGLRPRRSTSGIFDAHVASVLTTFQRRHMITNTGYLDEATRDALVADSREADFGALLRVLRERVVAATGLIEDGSALREWGLVVGRKIDTVEFQFDAGRGPVEGGAPDLVSRATDAAARALGLTDPVLATRALGALLEAGHSRVAVALPPLPDYHGPEMELRAEIDRGDVYYDFPYTLSGGRIRQPVERRPVLTLYARHEGREVALVRWPTTIGGWKTEVAPGGGVALTYKESPPGPRLWRDVIASPAWIPPPNTPDGDLVRRTPSGRYRANHSLFGPSYRSAYGLVMMMHHRELPPREEGDMPRLYDEGIRTHGSVSYRSIVRGTSHGCHRLYNHLAVRLASFLLGHRRHERHGSIELRYRRHFHYRGSFVDFRIDSRGYWYELTPPVPVEVLEGNIRGDRQHPYPGFRMLPSSVAAPDIGDEDD